MTPDYKARQGTAEDIINLVSVYNQLTSNGSSWGFYLKAVFL
jgi:hypothetical protein